MSYAVKTKTAPYICIRAFVKNVSIHIEKIVMPYFLFYKISSNLTVFSIVIEKIIIFYTDLMENVYLYKIREFLKQVKVMCQMSACTT